jgi:hypothetical protein
VDRRDVNRRDAAPNVGVLLPVRLETRFYPADGASGWRLRVLIVPDEPWIDRHNPVASAMERDSVERLWRAAPDGLGSEKGRIAWRVFVDRHGGPRAAWLARTYPPTAPPEPRPADLPAEPRFSRISGFPNELELWIGRGGQPAKSMARWPVKSDELQLDFPNPDDPNDARWWSSWGRATHVGLGIEVDLGADRPDDIDVLYVVGLGIGDPAALFSAHRDSGSLGLIAPGTPTNTIDGQPAADLGQHPDSWLQIALQPDSAGINRSRLSRALTGNYDAIGSVPGDTFEYRQDSLLMAALWPALWGHASEDIWGLGDAVVVGENIERAGLWAGGHVAPEGPFPAIRINDQPYGLLPATSLRRWRANGRDVQSDKVEEALQPSLIKALETWVEAANTAGNVVGADTNKLLDLLGRTSSSNGYAYRWFASLELVQLLYWTYDGGLTWPDVRTWWEVTSQRVLEYPVRPHRRYVTLGWPQDLRIHLVAPPHVRRDQRFGEYLLQHEQFDAQLLIREPIEFWFQAGAPSPHLPDSLLIRLLLHAVFVTAAEVRRAATSTRHAALEPIAADQNSRTRLAEMALAMTAADLRSGRPAAVMYATVREAIRLVLEQQVGDLDRALRATLDAAIYRLDPWITAYASRRLYWQTAETHRYQLGAFGWVDAPRPGTPGPTAGGLLHAPSSQQALTAVILRDRALHEAQQGRWDMKLESNTIRLAEQLAEEVRLGGHIREVLGRHVERIAVSPATIETLRNEFPIRDEHAGRRVCDGEKVLAADPATLPALTSAQHLALERLRRALDAYGDLLVVEAVHDVVAGRAAVAGASMDAAAGLAGPPNLEVLKTRPTGRGVNTNVLVAVPSVPDPPVAFDTSPGDLAEPAVAAFLTQVIGQPGAAPWRWHVLIPDRTVRVVHLSELGFSPIDTVMLSEEELGRLVLGLAPPGSVLDTAWSIIRPDDTRHVVRLSALGLPPMDIAILSERELSALLLAGQPAESRVDSPQPADGVAAQRRARRIVDVFGNQPAIPADLLDLDRTQRDDAVRQELRRRYERLRNVAAQLIDVIQTGATGGDEVLRLAARWGITPIARGDDTVADRLERARIALHERLEPAPAMTDVMSLDSKQLATAIAEMAAPEGQIAVLGRINLKNWPTTFAVAPTLDEEWLTINAAVRSSLARLEAHQLDAALGTGPALTAWTNRLDDPWQVHVSPTPSGIVPSTRLIVIYGPAGVLPSDITRDTVVAFGLLDSWGEVVPAVEQATTAAFGFNAPTARAPQTILLAVSPVENEPLNASTLVDIVAETRELARARMATPADLQAFDSALPLTMLPASGITTVHLEPRHGDDERDARRDHAVSV